MKDGREKKKIAVDLPKKTRQHYAVSHYSKYGGKVFIYNYYSRLFQVLCKLKNRYKTY